MSYAFETTIDDVLNVVHKMCFKANGDQIHKMCFKANGDQIHEIFDNLDQDKVEMAALKGDDMDEQIDLAYIEIEEQIKEMGIV